MLPPRQQPRSGVLHTSLSLVPADGSNSDQVRDSPTESASSRETWPASDALMLSKQQQLERDKAKERENGSAEHPVIRHISTSDKMSLRDIAKERVDVIAERMHHLPDDFLDKLKTELRSLIEGMGGHQHREEYIFLQKVVLSRTDLTEKTLVLAHRGQLEILVAKHFYIQLWIGCDSCSHWTHTDCAIQNAQIGMGPTVNGGSSGEMLFRCRACMRTSELFGWVKDVFHHCAPLWDREALVRELEYVSRIFRGSDEPRGRKLYWKCGELVEKLKSGVAEPLASKAILSFFQEFDIDPTKQHQEGGAEGGRLMAPQEAFNRIADVVQEAIKKMEMVEEEKIRSTKKARLALEACDQELKDKAREVTALKMERQKKKQQVDELESIVRLKQAEAEMFDLKASEARREAERLQSIAASKSEKSEDDYASRYLKQRLHEAEAEKQYLVEKMKLQESSSSRQSSMVGTGNEPSQLMMYNKIQDLLKNMYTAPSKGDGQSTDIRSLGSV